MKYVMPICAVATVLSPLPSFAADTQNDPLDFVITYSRVEQAIDELPASVTLIDRKQIEQSQAVSVPDLLHGIPGISLSNNGGLGKSTFINIRGAESDQVLVLIDGIKVGSATTGTTAFENLPVEQIDRIEIVRGARSSIYGSEAMGGVIQIFTKKGSDKNQLAFSLGAGSHKTYKGSASFSTSMGNGWLNGGISGIDSKGFNACNGEPLVAGCFTVEPDSDGYENLAANIRGGYRFNESASVDVHWLRSHGEADFDGDFANGNDQTQQVLGAGLDFTINKQWAMALDAGRSWDLTDSLKDGAFVSQFDTTRDSINWLNNITISENHSFVTGIDYTNDKVDSTTAYTVSERDNIGIYGQYIAQLAGHHVQLGLRNDDNEQFGNHTTGNVSWAYKFGGGFGVNASYATAFKAPTFNDLYFPGFSNPDLRPETSDSYELGLTKTHGWGNASITVFQTDIDDLIAFDSNTFAIENIDSASILGLEAALDTNLSGWQLKAALTLLDTENEGDTANNGNELPRRAKHTIRLDADRVYGDFSFGGTILNVGKRYDDTANSREMDAYTTVDLRGEYRISPTLRLQGRVENLFDEDYELASYYNTGGRSVFLTLRYQN